VFHRQDPGVGVADSQTGVAPECLEANRGVQTDLSPKSGTLSM
jgi:hypothetical protein